MFKSATLALAFALLCVVALCGRAEASKEFDDAIKLIEGAKTVELISLDPSPKERDPKGFHGWKVLGRTTLQNKATREKALAAIKKGVADSDGTVAGCFIPRHGIRAVNGKKTIDLVICFQCLSMQIWVDGERKGSALTTKSPQPTLDKVLRAAKVPLPKAAE
jgi:hypothetical protein